MKKMDAETFGKILVLAGLSVAVVGGGLWLLGRIGLPLGKLPGDIFIQQNGFSFYFPIATTILLSLALTVIVNIILRVIRK